nr:uncharacterized protein LOC112717809 [Arachis hypogaea]
MWNAAKATYLQEWERRMADIQKVDNGAYNHLMEIPTRYWCRHKFGTWSKCDTLVNNMCEVLNSVIVDAREKPIVSIIEDIRVYIMRRWADNRDWIIEYPREVLSRIRIKVEKQADASGKWVSTYAGHDKYEVTSIHGGKEKFIVDLKTHECSCRKFQLSGIPCAHAMTCITKMCFNVDNFVANCYKKATYSECYHIGHDKRTYPKKRKVAATASANKVAGSTRASRIISSTIFSTISSTISNQASKKSHPASKKTTMSRPKRKLSANDVSSQHSQTTSKKVKLTPSNNNLRVLPSPSKNMSKSQLKFMARTPPEA